jgi:hypothetical protein
VGLPTPSVRFCEYPAVHRFAGPIDLQMTLLEAWRKLDRSARLGWACVAVGLGLTLVVQAASPLPAPPLYDGVMVVEPYVWLDPPPDHPGGAQGASATISVDDARNAAVAVATPELTPQAQLVAVAGALTIRPTATSIHVSIRPVPSRPAPAGSYIDGNTYRIDVVDDAGNPISAPASAYVSIVLRPADQALTDASIELFDGEQWQSLETSSAGAAGFIAIVTAFGEFAVVEQGVSPYPTLAQSGATASPTQPPQGQRSVDPAAALLVGIVFGVALLIVLIARRRRRRGRPDGRDGWRS